MYYHWLLVLAAILDLQIHLVDLLEDSVKPDLFMLETRHMTNGAARVV
jgi:hypothetical protein